MARTYNGMPITKATVAFGIGGQLVRDDGFPEIPERADVEFKARATYQNVKHKFLDHGNVEEILILTINAESFKVLEVLEPPPEPEQQELGGTDEPAKE